MSCPPAGLLRRFPRAAVLGAVEPASSSDSRSREAVRAAMALRRATWAQDGVSRVLFGSAPWSARDTLRNERTGEKLGRWGDSGVRAHQVSDAGSNAVETNIAAVIPPLGLRVSCT